MSMCHILSDAQGQKCGRYLEKPKIFGIFPRLKEIFAEIKTVCILGKVKFFCLNQNCGLKERNNEKSGR